MDASPTPSQIPDYARLCRLSEAFPALDPDLVRAVGAVRDVGAQLGASVAASLAASGVTEGRLRLLGVLSIQGKPLAPSEIAEHSGVTRATVTGLVRQLEDQGYVARRDDPADRRRSLVELTPAGRALIEGVLPRHLAHIGSLLEGLDRGELRTLTRLLEKVERAVHRAPVPRSSAHPAPSAPAPTNDTSDGDAPARRR